MIKTAIYVALALSPCDKAITTLPSGVHIVAERTDWKSGYDLISISNDMQKIVSRYVDLSKEDFFKHLSIDGILHDHSVWTPVTDSVVTELLEEDEDLRDLMEFKDLLERAMINEGSQHKQWYLWKIVELLGMDLDIDADKGIAP